MLETIWVYGANSNNIRELIKKVGNKIGAVHFLKRKDGSLRKMAYRLHVVNPTTAKKPIYDSSNNLSVSGVNTSATDLDVVDNGVTPVATGNKIGSVVSSLASILKTKVYKSTIDYANEQMTVLDCNLVIKDKNNKIIGRGGWRTIPLENVIQITANGVRYIIKK